MSVSLAKKPMMSLSNQLRLLPRNYVRPRKLPKDAKRTDTIIPVLALLVRL